MCVCVCIYIYIYIYIYAHVTPGFLIGISHPRFENVTLMNDIYKNKFKILVTDTVLINEALKTPPS